MKFSNIDLIAKSNFCAIKKTYLLSFQVIQQNDNLIALPVLVGLTVHRGLERPHP